MSTLTGIRVYGATSFVDAFAPVLSRLEGLFFYERVSDSSFRFPWDDDSYRDKYLSCAIATDRDKDLLFPSKVLVDYASIVDEDWNAIQLLDTKDLRVHRRFEKQRLHLAQETVNRFVNQQIIFFHNFDGCFWQFFSNIAGLSNLIVGAHAGKQGFDLRHVDILEHYWNVGRYREDFPPRVG